MGLSIEEIVKAKDFAEIVADKIVEKQKAYVRSIALFCCVIFALSFLWGVFIQETDPTDEGKLNRSGMKIYFDAETGVEYLGTAHGGLTPRIKAND